MLRMISNNRAAGILISLFVYILAIPFAVWVASLYTPAHPLLLILYGTLAGTVFVFMFSMIFNNSSMYDPYWSVQPVVIGVYYAYQPDHLDLRGSVVLGLLVFYGLRLTLNFYRGWQGLEHEDWRYRKFRAQFERWYWLVSFFGFHLFPTLIVYLACLPLFAIFSSPREWNTLDIVAGLLFLGSIVLSFIADEQKRTFRKMAKPGALFQAGLWSLCRHPNYLGEILSWTALFLFALSARPDLWWTGAGALAIWLLFIFISIPMIERRMENRYPEYRAYSKCVRMLIPWPKSPLA